MAYQILNLYRDLPGTHCGECGKSGCFAFAGGVFLEDLPLATCPHLAPEAAAVIAARMVPASKVTEAADAAEFTTLRDRLRAADWRALTSATGGVSSDGPDGTRPLAVLGRPFRVSPEGIRGEAAALSPRLEIAVLDYLLQGHVGEPAGTWVAYRDLRGTAHWSKAFQSCVDRLAPVFGGKLPALDRVALALDARRHPEGSASRAYRVPALPRVELLLRFWDREEDPEGRAAVRDPAYGRFTAAGDFDARAEVLVDAAAPSGLSPQSLFFLVEALVERLVA